MKLYLVKLFPRWSRFEHYNFSYCLQKVISDHYLPPIHTKSLLIMLILVATFIKSINLAHRKSKSFLQPLGSPRWSIHKISCAKGKLCQVEGSLNITRNHLSCPRKFYLATICIISRGIVNKSKIRWSWNIGQTYSPFHCDYYFDDYSLCHLIRLFTGTFDQKWIRSSWNKPKIAYLATRA